MDLIRKILGKLLVVTVGLFFVISADLGSGILLTNFWSRIFKPPVDLWYCYAFGVVVALLPDFDLGYKFIARKKIDSRHRDVLHYPMGIIPVSLLIGIGVYLANPELMPWFWTILAASCLFLHFVHDSLGEANRWGVKWLAPFSPNKYQLLMWKVPGGLLQRFCTWTPKELGEVEHLSPVSVEAWIRTYYLKLTAELSFSLLWLVLAVYIAFPK